MTTQHISIYFMNLIIKWTLSPGEI